MEGSGVVAKWLEALVVLPGEPESVPTPHLNYL